MTDSIRRNLILTFALAAVLCACGGQQAESVGDADATDAVTDAESPAALAEMARELMPRLERLSGLDRRETLRLRTQDREAARSYVLERLETEMPAAEREAMKRVYTLLGLVPDTLDLDALLLDLYTEQVLGYYDPDTRTMWVVDGVPEDDLRPVLAHELVHALQDQHTDLQAIIDGSNGNDRQTAAHAAMEGHAMLVMFAVIAEGRGRPIDPAQLPDPSEPLMAALAEGNQDFPVFQRAPRVIRETLLFPYIGGAGFVHALWRDRAPQPRYPAPIDSLLPGSTEQVLYPVDRFIRTRDEPVDLEWSAPPGGWTVLREDNLGQLETRILLEEHGVDGDAADGWDGDRYALLQHDAGAEALLWASVWDSDAEAQRFSVALARALPAADVSRVDIGGLPGVRMILSPAAAAPADMRATPVH